MKYYPLFADLNNKNVLVIGGGNVAERKVITLLKANADITVIAPQITKRINQFANKKKIILIKREFKSSDIKNFWLVFAATDNIKVQQVIYKECEKKKIFLNIVDIPDYCSFIVPSIIKRGDLILAISTSGKSPALAKVLRKSLEKKFQRNWDVILNNLAKERKKILKLKISAKEKKQRLTTIAEETVNNLFKE